MRFAGGPKMANFFADAPRFDQITNMATRARSENRAMNHEAEGFIASSGLNAMSKIKQAGHQARAIVAGGEADAAASQAQGMSGMMSGIAGGIGNISFGGNSSSTTSPVTTYYNNKGAFNAGTNRFYDFANQ